MGWRPGLSFELLMGSSRLLNVAESKMRREYEALEAQQRTAQFQAMADAFAAKKA